MDAAPDKPQKDADLRALEAFVVDNEELEQLETLLAPFNLFDAIGVNKQELRHSDFLGYLLDPMQNHGLGDALARSLLVAALKSIAPGDRSLSLVDLDVVGLGDLEVRREWRHIDLLLLSRRLDLAVIIENKVFSGEHDDQLARYQHEVSDRRMARRIVGIYLTPTGEPASEPEFASLSYEDVCKTVERLVEQRGSTAGDAVAIVMSHYAQMLRRHILVDSDVAELARAIYRKHRQALDRIFEQRPDLQAELYEKLVEWIDSRPELSLDTSTKRYVRFAPKVWDEHIPLLGRGWVGSGRLLVLEFRNQPGGLRLALIIGPGDSRLRQQLFDWAVSHRPFFKPSRKTLGASWTRVWEHEILSRDDVEAEPDEAFAALDERLGETGSDIGQISAFVSELKLAPNA